MNIKMIIRQKVLGLIVAAVVVLAQGALGADGTWTNLAGGAWSTAGNWLGGTVADGTDAIADFSTLNITAGTFVNNDAARTVGTLHFGDTTASHNWTLQNAALTLAVSSGTPTITVDNQTATITASLTGSQGLIKNGAGTLSLVDVLNNYSGGTYVLAGTLRHGAWDWADNLGTGPVYLGDTNGSASVVLQQKYGSIAMPNNIVLQSGGSGTITFQASGGNDWFDGTITLGSPNSSGRSLTIAGNNLSFYFRYSVIQDPVGLTPGTAGQITIAASPVIFEANNTYSGGTVINSGSLHLRHVNALGTGGLTVNSGVVNLDTRSVSMPSLSGTGGIIRDDGAAGTTTLTVNQSTNTTFSGVISDGASRVVAVTKTGSGALTIAGANTYSGATWVNAGKLVGGTGSNCGKSSVVVATGATNGVKAVVYGAGGSLIYSNLTYMGDSGLVFDMATLPVNSAVAPLIINGDLTVTGVVQVSVSNGYWPATGTYPLVRYTGNLNGPGSFSLADLPAGVSATLVNNTGAKRLELNVTAIPVVSFPSSVWTNNVGGTWGTAGNWDGGTIADGTDVIADFSTLNITANAIVNNDAPHTVGQLRFGDTTPSHNWTLINSTLTLARSLGLPTIDVSNGNATVSVSLQGTQGLFKTGAGTLSLDAGTKADAGNTYSGGTYVLAGTLRYGASGANYVANKLGTGPVYLGDTSGSASVVLQQIYDSDILPNNIVLQSGGSGTITIQGGGGNDLFDGAITLGSFNSSGRSLTIAGGSLQLNFRYSVIQDPVGLTPGTAGQVTIAASPVYFGGNNTYSGGTVINSGFLQLGHVNALGTGGLTVNSGVVNLNTMSISIPSLSGTGGIITDYNGAAGTTTLTVNQSTNTTYSGVITNGASRVLALVKKGSGTLTLAGTNTYTGATAVSNGTLAVSGALSSSAVTVCTGAAFAAGSTGIVGRATLGGTLTFENGSALLVDVVSVAADAVEVTGNVVIGTGVEVRLSGNQEKSGSWDVIKSTTGTVQGSDPVLINGLNGAKLTRTATAIVLTIPPKGTMIRVL